MITSTSNVKVHWVRKLNARRKEREKEGCYIAEGIRLVEEIWRARQKLRQVYYCAPLSDRIRKLLEEITAAGIPAEEVSESVMKAMSDTETPQGILVVAEMDCLPLPDVARLVLILDGIHDPGNLGTILRTAVAAAADLVFLAPGCADLYAPKVIRSAMGNHCKVPVRQAEWAEIQAFCSTHSDLRFYASALDGATGLWQTAWAEKVGLIIGSEAEGISAEAEKLAQERVFIPMRHEVESLNAAVAAGILLYEAVRHLEIAGRKGFAIP